MGQAENRITKKIKAVDNSEAINKLTDIMDKDFPLEESLVQPLLEIIVKELSNYLYQPADNENNDNDDLSKLANYISRNLRERRG